MDETGYIYIVKFPPYYKVGKAYNLKARFQSYRRTEGREPRVIFTRHVKYNWEVEERLIALCQNYPSRGAEWFKLPRRKVWRLIKYLKTIPEVPGECNRKAYLREQKRQWQRLERQVDYSTPVWLNGQLIRKPNARSNGITTVNTP